MNTKKQKTKLRPGDFVQVIAGKEKGKRGKITQMLLRKGRALVEGVGIVKRHMKATRKDPQGGILAKEGTIHLSNLMIVDPKTDKPTRLGKKSVPGKAGKKGTSVRVTQASGTVLDTKGGQ